MVTPEVVAAGLALEIQGLITTWLGGPTDIWPDGVQHRVAVMSESLDGTVAVQVKSLDGTELEGRYEIKAAVRRVE